MPDVLNLPRTAEQLLCDAAKLPELVKAIKADRHTMCIPPQPDDWDLLLTRLADTVPGVVAELERLRAFRAAADAHASLIFD